MCVELGAEHVVLSTMDQVDKLIFGDPWAMDDDPGSRLDLIRAAVQRHLAFCSSYARYAAQLGFNTDALREPSDLARIPQIPTLAFKRDKITSCPEGDIAKCCTSSGTLGRRSIVYRDRTTLERLLGSVERGFDLIGEWYEDELAIVNLGPSQTEAGDLWFAYMMSLVELGFHTEHLVRNGSFEASRALIAVQNLLNAYSQVIVIGPPALVLALAASASSAIDPLPGSRVTVVTAGGWKRDSGTVIDRRNFLEAVIGGLSLPGPEHVRDAFNQVELNTVIMECDANRKHVPPWLEVIVRDPRTLEPVPNGQIGLLSYLDPTATSFPCFLLADDFGTLEFQTCTCGRSGRLLTVERRIERAEDWGCALKMDHYYGTPA
jgi:long-chain-fatty-acid---luciferin-component ligase